MRPIFWFAAWSCDCTDLQATREEIPDLCPCHPDARLLGVEQCTPGISTNLGHMCPEPTDSEGSTS